MASKSVFRFKQFDIHQDRCAMKVNTDGVLLGSWSKIEQKKTILDIGTGTGVVAIMLAQRALEANIHGVELDENSYLQATENIQRSPFANRMACFHQCIQDYACQNEYRYDLIVSNPPFFESGNIASDKSKANARHTLELPHEDLLKSVSNLITYDGHFDVILPFTEGRKFIVLAVEYGFIAENIAEVIPYEGKNTERILIRFSRSYTGETVIKPLILHKSTRANDYSDAVIQLTQSYYLFM